MSDKKYVVGYGFIDSSYFCGYVTEELSSYLGNGAKQKLTELIFDADVQTFISALDPVFNGMMSAATTVVRILTQQDGYRRVRIRVSLHKDSTCLLEVTDIDNAVDDVVYSRYELHRMAFLLEKRKDIIFEYHYQQNHLEIFKYEHLERVSLQSNPVYAFLYESILREITNPTAGSIRFVFDNTYTYNGIKYHVTGNDLIQNAEKSVLIGVIETVNSAENEASDRVDTHDAMTGLYNKPYSLTLAKESLNTKDKVSIVMMDIDDFKTINDSYGHVFGDEVIKKLALILNEMVTNRGFAGRFGGDEFFLCLYDIESEQELRALLQGIYYHFKRAFPDKDHQFSLTMGIAEYPRSGTNFDLLLKKADRALYIGKFKGKNRYIIYKEHIHGELSEDDSSETNIVHDESANRQTQIAKLKNATILLAKALRDGSDAKETLDEVFKELIGVYKCDGVNIFAGENFESVYRFGNLTNPIEEASYIKAPEVVAQFNDLGLFHTAVKYVRDKYIEEFHGNLAKHGYITSTQVIIGTREAVKALFSYDAEHDLGSCSLEEMTELVIISQMAAELLLK